MECHHVGRARVHLALRLGQHLEDGEASRFDRLRQRRRLNQRADVCHRAVFMVPVLSIMVPMMGQLDIDIAGRNAVLHDGLHLHRITALDGKLRKLGAQMCLRHARRQEGTEQHVAADARETIEINRFHIHSPQRRWLILLASTPAPKPLSMLTTLTPAAQLLSIAKRAVTPWNAAP